MILTALDDIILPKILLVSRGLSGWPCRGVWMHKDKEKVILTVDEVAEILRISRASAYEACRRGEIPTIKIGRRVLVPRKGLDRLIAGDVTSSLKSA